MRELTTEIEIDAPAGRVWAILTDLGQYEEWNPFIRDATGDVKPGSRLSVSIEPPGGRAMTFRPTVTLVSPGREFRWLGRFLMPGLFDGEHIFEVAPAGEGRTRLVQREQFRGVLVPLLWTGLATSTRQGFEAMNDALKKRAEKGHQ